MRARIWRVDLARRHQGRLSARSTDPLLVPVRDHAEYAQAPVHILIHVKTATMRRPPAQADRTWVNQARLTQPAEYFRVFIRDFAFR
jgi:hypothetical protein